MAGGPADGSTYSAKVAFAFIFNLIVGVGALALPSAFAKAGLLLGSLFLLFMALMAFVTLTFVVETMSYANAHLSLANGFEKDSDAHARLLDNEDNFHEDEKPAQALSIPSAESFSTNPFEITRRTEMGYMAELFFGEKGRKGFLAALAIYLYGDLAIYGASVPKTLADVFPLNSGSSYHIYVACFSAVAIPLSLFNFQKTKPIQLVTLATRNIAFWMMIILAIIFIAQGNGAPASALTWFNLAELPGLLGGTLYSYMCHHSAPGIITPIKEKKGLFRLLFADFSCVFVAYVLVSVSSMFAFGNETNPTCGSTPGAPCEIQSLYTLNFSSYHIVFIAKFLALFPVFTLTSSFPLIAITLRNNLMLLFGAGAPESMSFRRRTLWSLLAVVPPLCIAFATDNIKLLVSVTGSYAGLVIQFIAPALLVHYARKQIASSPAFKTYFKNPYLSPFSSSKWIVFVLGFSAVSLVVVTINIIYENATGKTL